MGTIIQAGSCVGVVVATGGRAEFGRIALGLGERQPQTEFQRGLGRFSLLLLQVAIVLTSLIFIANLLLHRPLLESLLFSLAIAVGITPQLLPAVVSTSLATGTRQLARRQVLVKRLVCIEDLGDMDVLVTDKTGTLTEGTHQLHRRHCPVDPALERRRLDHPGAAGDGGGLLRRHAASAVGRNPLDAALWEAAGRRGFDPGRIRAAGSDPVRPQRRMTSALVRTGERSRHGWSPRARRKTSCGTVRDVPEAARRCWMSSSTPVPGSSPWPPGPPTGTNVAGAADETGLALAGFLVFLDRPKANAKDIA